MLALSPRPAPRRPRRPGPPACRFCSSQPRDPLFSSGVMTTAPRALADDEPFEDLDPFDAVKEALSRDDSDTGVAFCKDIFEGKSPSEVRKSILGPQLSTRASLQHVHSQ